MHNSIPCKRFDFLGRIVWEGTAVEAQEITQVSARYTKVFEGTPGYGAMGIVLQAIESCRAEDASEVAVVLVEGPHSSFSRPSIKQGSQVN